MFLYFCILVFRCRRSTDAVVAAGLSVDLIQTSTVYSTTISLSSPLPQFSSWIRWNLQRYLLADRETILWSFFYRPSKRSITSQPERYSHSYFLVFLLKSRLQFLGVRLYFWCTVVFWCTVSKVNIEVEPPWVTLDDNRNNNTTTHQPSVSKSSITIIIVVLIIIIVSVIIIIVPVLLALSDTVYCFKVLMQFCCIAYPWEVGNANGCNSWWCI